MAGRAGGADGSVDAKLLAMQELMAEKRKAAVAGKAAIQAQPVVVRCDISAADDQQLAQLLMQHYSRERPIAEHLTLRVSPTTCSAGSPSEYNQTKCCTCLRSSLAQPVRPMHDNLGNGCPRWCQVGCLRIQEAAGFNWAPKLAPSPQPLQLPPAGVRCVQAAVISPGQPA